MKLLFYTLIFILYLVVIALWIIIPEHITLNISTLIAALVMTILLIIYDRERFHSLYSSLWFKKFTSTLISAFLIFCILGLVNYLAYRHPFIWDFSREKKNSLTKQSSSVLSSLKNELIFHVFTRKEDAPVITALLELYRPLKKDTKIKVIDVELRPDLVQKYKVKNPRTVVVEYNNRYFNVSGGISELAITNAIIYLSRDKNPLIYYSTNHGEHLLEDKGKEGVSELVNFLRESHIDIKEVNTAVLSSIPPEVNALLIWGPKSRFLKNELNLIENFLTRGGKLIVALNPDLNKDQVPGLRSLLNRFGVQIHNDLVVDTKEHINGSNGTVPLIKNYSSHPITKDFKGVLFFPLASSIEKSSLEAKGIFTPLAFTSEYPASWAEKTGKEILKGKLRFHDNKDKKGPIAIAAIWQKENDNGKKSRIMAFGNSTFVSNAYSGFGGHLLFFHNGISWIVDEERLISFNLPTIKDDPVFISSTEVGVVFYFSVIFAPLVLFSLALYSYKRRRLV